MASTSRSHSDAANADDVIFIDKLNVEGILGVRPWERRKRQPVVVSIRLTMDTRRAAASRKLRDAVDYSAVMEAVRAHVGRSKELLIETLCQSIATLCLEYAPVTRVWVRIEKPWAAKDAGAVGIEISRQRTPPRRSRAKQARATGEPR